MPAAKPAVAKALAGEKRPSRLRPSAVATATPAPPHPPADLTGMALAVWHELAPQIWRAGYLVESDRTAFAVLCGIFGNGTDGARGAGG